jgi:hypothetical protein
MVKICNGGYPLDQEAKYKEYFDKYPYRLSNFQKFALEAIVEGDHVLVTAHTGSGKTLPAEFAIEYFVGQGKKVIYTAPIKALSNQKFYEFTRKYPGISFGILTGDIKTNPEADVLIMTTEILLNTLYNKKNKSGGSLLEFDMNFDTELACVVFDEVHYINDPERGKVWEESIMMLPPHVQMVMLSATIDAPERFAAWCESKDPLKQVYLTSTHVRVVPLTHYSFITTNSAIFKAVKNKDLEKQIREMTNGLFVIQTPAGEFNEPHYHKMRKMLDLFETNRVFVKRAHVLNEVCRWMVDHDMLPALCFVLSRKQIAACAKEITVPLLEFDSKVGYTIRRECEQIIRKLPNFEEYLHLPEYLELVALLEKGIGIHHSGVMPVLKEMVEILYSRGYIKLLFSTETMSIGVNMPTKTVVFTDCNKFDGNVNRVFYSHEYTQMAGRAGRRGIDVAGHVIHLNNLFKNLDSTSYKKMMQGKPQSLVSKFKISFSLLLNLIDMGETDFTSYTERSMIQGEFQTEAIGYKDQADEYEQELKQLESMSLRTPRQLVEEYIRLETDIPQLVNKKRKEAEKRVREIMDEYKNLNFDKEIVKKILEKQDALQRLKDNIVGVETYMDKNVQKILRLFQEKGFINETAELTPKGVIATHLKEIHCLVFADLLESGRLDALHARQLVGVLSCFTNIAVSEDKKTNRPRCEDLTTETTIREISEMYDMYLRCEEEERMDSGTSYDMHYDLADTVMQWCDCEDVVGCKLVLQNLVAEKGVFLGEFVKALLKINNISAEMEKIAEMNGKMEFLSKLREIPRMTLKYVATNQSLYI